MCSTILQRCMKYNFKFKGPQESLIQCIGPKMVDMPPNCRDFHRVREVSNHGIFHGVRGFSMRRCSNKWQLLHDNSNTKGTIQITSKNNCSSWIYLFDLLPKHTWLTWYILLPCQSYSRVYQSKHLLSICAEEIQACIAIVTLSSACLLVFNQDSAASFLGKIDGP